MSLNEVLIDELRDLYSAENQLVKALPKSIKGTNDAQMKQHLRDHLEQTKGHVLRLREVFQQLGKKPTGQHCSGMEGCLKEVQEALEKDEEGALKDAGLIGAALRVEHYEIAGYTAAIAMAKAIGQKEVVAHLTETLNEEKQAGNNILADAKSILKTAASQKEDEPAKKQEKKPKSPKEKESEHESEKDEAEAAPEMASATASAAKPK